MPDLIKANSDSVDQTFQTVANIRMILNVWDRTANRLFYLTVFFGILTIVTSVFVSVYTATTFICPAGLKILACTSTASLTLLTAFNVVKKGNNSRKAWRILNAALYKYDSNVFSIEQLINDYEVGESIVGDVDFSYGVTSKAEELKINQIDQAISKAKRRKDTENE